MGSSLANDLSPLQRAVLEGFFKREARFFLTGGGALVGFYFHHRATDDLDFFTNSIVDLAVGTAALQDTARELSTQFEALTEFADFRRYKLTRGNETCLVDLVVDRAPAVDPAKKLIGTTRVDTLREIAANKVSALIGRSEIRDLVDLRVLLESGVTLEGALADAATKDASADALTLAFVLNEIRIGADASLPDATAPASLDAFRKDLVVRLRRLALERVARRQP